jgi:plastocyanin
VVCSLLAASAVAAGATAGLVSAAGAAGTKGNPIKAKTSSSAGFNPKSVTVKRGQVVYFKSTDKAPHNATASKKVKGKPAFAIGPSSGSTGTFSGKVNAAPGTYAYICTIHPFMKGTLVVKK